jgi:hypothetical protein
MQGTVADLFACSTDRGFAARRIAVILAFSTCLVLSACHKGDEQTTRKRATKPVLSASPNPVPTGDLDKPLGSTQITWNTNSQTTGDLYVKVNRSPEVFLARGPAGTFDANWIQFDALYEFRLYVKKRSRLIARIEVTRDD